MVLVKKPGSENVNILKTEEGLHLLIPVEMQSYLKEKYVIHKNAQFIQNGLNGANVPCPVAAGSNSETGHVFYHQFQICFLPNKLSYVMDHPRK